jgi:mRNA (2'-O-methyladenosine-N6-)-methyltransferase
MELGRECLDIWGYKRVDELIWVKVNQLQRLIRTGRTGHWLNHSKEHCLVGVKGNPNINRNVDCDVVVGEVRSHSSRLPLIAVLSRACLVLELPLEEYNSADLLEGLCFAVGEAIARQQYHGLRCI